MTMPTTHENAAWATCLGTDERCPEFPVKHDLLPWADPYIASLVANTVGVKTQTAQHCANLLGCLETH